jgi:hypothetical protein
VNRLFRNVRDEREKETLAACVRAATGCTPMIVRSVVNAAHSSKPSSWRRQQLDNAIRHTRALLDELNTQKAALGWRDREGDVA